MDHLDRLEYKSVHIFREAYANFKNLGMLWSIGKDSTVMLWLARKAFFGHVPFPLVHIDTAFKMAKGIQAGTVWVNAYHSAGLPYMPYGGYKQSGIGRELGHEGLEEYMETKAIQLKLG